MRFPLPPFPPAFQNTDAYAILHRIHVEVYYGVLYIHSQLHLSPCLSCNVVGNPCLHAFPDTAVSYKAWNLVLYRIGWPAKKVITTLGTDKVHTVRILLAHTPHA